MKNVFKLDGKNFLLTSRFWATVVVVVIISGLMADKTKADSNNFYSDILRLESVTNKIHQGYVEEIESEDLIDNAIEGMMSILDPHTTFFKKKDYEELKIHTEGKFGGLGIQISIRDKILTVMTPISGTPASRAGIQSGDKIIEIEGKSTKGITIDKAVAKLRGEPGSDVTITIARKGEAEPLKFTITREIITIHSVPFYGMLQDKIGYVKLLTFSQDAGDEVGKAVEELVKQGVEGLVFDLRNNPGGLLPQAISVSEKFLKKGNLVVFTRGRSRLQNKEYNAAVDGVLPAEVPVVVLVNRASASASEIVSGAIQDWDRGVILGDTTFGKGSVQSIVPIDADHHIKLTTAFYYTPAGRCINRKENGVRGDGGGDDFLEEENADSTEAVEKEEDEKDTTTYFTKGGRRVYGGGGIIPDTIVEPDDMDLFIRTLLLKDAFFKFANSRYPGLKKKGTVVDSSFEISDGMLESFTSYLDSVNFEFTSPAKLRFEDFKKRAGFLADTTLDSIELELYKKLEPRLSNEEKDKMSKILSEIDNILISAERRDLTEGHDKIRRYLKEAFLVRSLGQDHEVVFRMKLAEDNQVKTAISLLKNNVAYSKELQAVKEK